jgi:hypothetical protein
VLVEPLAVVLAHLSPHLWGALYLAKSSIAVDILCDDWCLVFRRNYLHHSGRELDFLARSGFSEVECALSESKFCLLIHVYGDFLLSKSSLFVRELHLGKTISLFSLGTPLARPNHDTF